MDPAVVGVENGGARSLLSADIWGSNLLLALGDAQPDII